MVKKLGLLDCFAGVGGFTCGLKMTGKFKPVAALDMNQAAANVYSKNHPEAAVVVGSVTSKAVQDYILKNYKDKIDVVVGGPPCQSFSKLNHDTRTTSNPLAKLPLVYIDFALQFNPMLIIMEEVAAVIQLGNVFQRCVSRLKNAGYAVKYGVLKAEEYGVAQTRHRMFLVAYRKDKMICNFPPPQMSTKQTVSLEKTLKGVRVNRSDIKELSGKSLEHVKQREATGSVDTKCFKECYKVLDMKAPSGTLTCHMGQAGCGKFTMKRPNGTYTQITVREGARIQGFPDGYVFSDKLADAYKQIGNAVCPIVAKAIGDHVILL